MTGIAVKQIDRVGKTVAYMYPAYDDGSTKGQPCLFWARNGLVAFEDRRPDAFRRSGTMSWQDAEKRMLAVQKMMPQQAEDPRKHFRFERTRQDKFLAAMMEVIREARAMGGPFDGDPNYGRPKLILPGEVRNNDDFLAQNNLLRPGTRQANGVVRLAECDF
jgi:hypothetical protein